MSNGPKTLADAILEEMTRVRDNVMPAYLEIGPSGAYALLGHSTHWLRIVGGWNRTRSRMLRWTRFFRSSALQRSVSMELPGATVVVGPRAGHSTGVALHATCASTLGRVIDEAAKTTALDPALQGGSTR
jgi:hypothetical protein